jgi:hypothetical protein
MTLEAYQRKCESERHRELSAALVSGLLMAARSQRTNSDVIELRTCLACHTPKAGFIHIMSDTPQKQQQQRLRHALSLQELYELCNCEPG